MKNIIFLFFLVFAAVNTIAKTYNIHELNKELDTAKSDNSKFNILQEFIEYYQDSKPDSIKFYANEEYDLSNRDNSAKWTAWSISNLGIYDYIEGNYPGALKLFHKSLEYADSINDEQLILQIKLNLGVAYREFGQPFDAKRYFLQSKILAEQKKYKWAMMFSYMNLAFVYTTLNNNDSAEWYGIQAKQMSENSRWTGVTFLTLADINLNLKNKALALDYYRMSIDSLKKYFVSSRLLSMSYLGLADYYRIYHPNDSAVYYAHLSINIANEMHYLKGILNGANFLYGFYDSIGQVDSSLAYLKKYVSINEKLYSKESVTNVEDITFLETIRQNEKLHLIETIREDTWIALGIIVFVIIILLITSFIIVNTNIISFFATVALLVVFEFINLLEHSYLERVTHQSPLLIFFALVCIAAVLVPLRSKSEKIVKNVLEKNKQRRLAKRQFKIRNRKVTVIPDNEGGKL